jgi:long-chain acyl-CoA synthetase
VDEKIDSLEPNQAATFIYTSGTTGPPKAVMLSHENLTFTADKAIGLIDINDEDLSLSYLPLSHIAEQMFSIHAPISVASQVFFAESLDKLPDNLKEVSPTMFFGVPRIWEKFYAKINIALEGLTGVKKKLIPWTMKVAKEVNELRNRGMAPSGLLRFKYKIARKVLGKLKAKIGLGMARMCISGAAPISKEILEFMSSLDVVIYEVYGQSEGSGPTSFNRPGSTKFGTVGPAFPGVEVKIAEEDGEILFRGKNVFLGYYKDTDATNSTLIDGWLHSGDIGELDSDGFLTITGRKKEIIITAGGKNIAPKNIEAALKNIPLISQAVVIGDRRKFLSALLTLDVDAAEIFATQNNISTEGIHENDLLLASLKSSVEAMNKTFAKVENIRKFKVLPRDLSVDEKELTPTLKVKRRIVHKNWADTIESMYQ